MKNRRDENPLEAQVRRLTEAAEAETDDCLRQSCPHPRHESQTFTQYTLSFGLPQPCMDMRQSPDPKERKRVQFFPDADFAFIDVSSPKLRAFVRAALPVKIETGDEFLYLPWCEAIDTDELHVAFRITSTHDREGAKGVAVKAKIASYLYPFVQTFGAEVTVRVDPKSFTYYVARSHDQTIKRLLSETWSAQEHAKYSAEIHAAIRH